MSRYRLPIAKINGFSIIFHTQSINEALDKGDERVLRLMEWQKDGLFKPNFDEDPGLYFEFFRTPGPSNHVELSNIPEYQVIDHEKGNTSIVLINRSNGPLRIDYRKREWDIKMIAWQLTGNDFEEPPDENALLLVEYFFILSYCNQFHSDHPFLLCTEDQFLLTNRNRVKIDDWLGPAPVTNLEETMRLLDLCMKGHGEYRIEPNQLIKGKDAWYSLLVTANLEYWSSRGEHGYEALSTRLGYLLRTNDEMAFSYYSEVNLETVDSIVYYFHYYLALAVGIFDTLAAIANERYELGVVGFHVSISVIRNGGGKSLLSQLKGKNESLHQFIIEKQDIIQAISKLRDEVIHRDMLDRTIFDISGTNGAWTAGFLKILPDHYATLSGYCHGSKEISRADNDSPFRCDVFDTQSGQETIYHVEPYAISTALTKFMFAFVNRFIELIGGLETNSLLENYPGLKQFKKSSLRIWDNDPCLLKKER